MALAPLAELAQSYLDIRWHLDPVAATRAGVAHYDDRLGRFAPDALRPHLAALKSLTGALEELEPPDLDAEIDRTALLNDARVLQYRIERERVFARDPAQWTDRLFEGLTLPAAPAALRARVEDVPGFLDDARIALAEPVGLFATIALDRVADAEQAVRAAAATAGLTADESARVLAALTAFLGDLERWAHAAPGRFAAGEDAFNFHLHFEHALRDTAPELWRYGHRVLEELDRAETTLADPGPLPEWELAGDLSPVRLLIRASATVDGWALLREPTRERLRRHAVAILLDVGLHTRGLSTADGLALLDAHLGLPPAEALRLVHRTAATPTLGLAAAAGRRDWLRLREAFPSAAAFAAAVRPYGGLPISLIRWGLGLGD